MSDPQGFEPPPLPSEPGTRLPPPWEREGPAVQRFIDTAKGVLAQPVPFFASMKREGGLAPPLIFAFVGSLVGSIGSYLGRFMMPFGGLGMSGAYSGFAFGVVMIPILSILGLLVGAGILQVLLVLLAHTRQPFETTARVVAYTVGSTSPLNIIPFVGGLVAGVWALVVLVLGTAEAHEVSQGQAAVAVLLPAVLCCVIAALFGGALLALILGAAAAGWHS